MDCIWYTLGTRHGERALAFIRRITKANEEDMAKLPLIFHEHPARILITAKLLGGFGMMPLILFTAGAAKMPFGRYIALNAFGEIFWTGGFLALGYYFGSYVLQINGVFEKVSAGVLVIALIILFYWAGRQIYRKVIL
jgi:membrane protein DedA with SNARE-associated domain